MTSRKPLSLSDKVAIFAAKALCPTCFKPFAGQVDFDHEIELARGGADDVSNLRPLCRSCHKAKTIANAGKVAKSRRVTRKHENHVARMAGEPEPHKTRRKKAIPARKNPWPTGQKLQSRPFETRRK